MLTTEKLIGVTPEEPKSSIEKIVYILKKISFDWNVECVKNVANTNICSLSILSDGVSVDIKIVPIFEEKVMLYVKSAGVCRAVQVNLDEYEGVDENLGIASKISATIFAPIFRPYSEYPSLSQLSLTPLLHICGYVLVRF